MESRESTKTEYVNSLNKVLVFIQSNIDRKLSLQELSEVAGFSCFHFHRIFSAFVGESPGSYIRRLTLEKSARMLAYSDKSITDISFENGFETPSSYSRAFKKVFGVSPSEYKNTVPVVLKSNEEYQKVLKELVMQNFLGIKELEDMNVLYVRKTGNYEEAACQAWSVLMKYCYSNKIRMEGTKCIGIGYDDPSITPENKLRYDACITCEDDIKVEGEISTQIIKGGKYAVFLHKGSYKNLNETYRAIFMEWVPSNGKQVANKPSFELYLNRDPRRTKPENLRTEIYIPIE